MIKLNIVVTSRLKGEDWVSTRTCLDLADFDPWYTRLKNDQRAFEYMLDMSWYVDSVYIEDLATIIDIMRGDRLVPKPILWDVHKAIEERLPHMLKQWVCKNREVSFDD
jgi:hypothetical protein